jgi:hypothetical protein
MRIAYLANSTPNGFYRAVGPMDHLAYRGHDVLQLSKLAPAARLAAVRDVDLLHVHRYCDVEHTVPLIREAKQHGAAVAWDDDDDLGSVSQHSDAAKNLRGLKWERRLAAMRAIFGMAELVTTTNAHLADRLEAYGARNVLVIENYVPALFLLPRDRASRDGITIGWVAGREHQLDVEELGIVPLLQRILDERSDVRVVSVGLRLGLRSPRYEPRGGVPVLKLADETARFDIAIAPLADTQFNRSKSNVKLKEYAAGGAAWLASATGPYLGMGERQGGRLVIDHAWADELRRLLDKPRDRRKLAKRGLKWVAEETLERNAHRWEIAFAQAVERARAGRASAARTRSAVPQA